MPDRVRFSPTWFPVQTFFNALPDASFVDAVRDLCRGVGRSVNACHCTFPGDLDPGDPPHRGVEFAVHESSVILTYEQFFYALGVACAAQRARAPDQAAALDRTLEQMNPAWRTTIPPPVTGWLLQALDRIRQRPGAWLGDETADSLERYLSGYEMALRDLGIEPSFEYSLRPFTEWMRQRHGYERSTIGWADVINRMDDSPRNVFTFFAEFDAYLEEKGVAWAWTQDSSRV